MQLEQVLTAAHPGSLATPCGTCPAATLWCWRALSILCCESSKKISAPKASRNGPLCRPPKNSASSKRTPHSRKVRMTRSCAGAERAVTNAVRIGEASPDGNAVCNAWSADKKLRNGPRLTAHVHVHAHGEQTPPSLAPGRCVPPHRQR